MPKVLLASPIIQQYKGKYLDSLRDAGCEIATPSEGLDERVLKKVIVDAHAIIAGSEPYTAEVLECAPRLKIIARAGVGYDAVDIPAATRLGIAVTIAPGSNHHAVADFAMALVLALGRQIIPYDREVRSGGWKRDSVISPNGAVLGIIGFGRVGQSVAKRARAFDMRILTAEPYPDMDRIRDLEVELVPLERLLQESDFVSLNCPMSKETKGIINANTLALMKPSAYLVNTARGELIDEDALYDALSSHRLAGAGLDVFASEPLLIDSPLRSLDKVIFSPHIAGVDDLSFHLMTQMAADAIIEVLRGGWPESVCVNPDARKNQKP